MAQRSAAKTITMKPLLQGGEDFIVLEEQDWELIDRFDADSDTESLHSVEDGFLSWDNFTAPDSPKPDRDLHSQNTLQEADAIDHVVAPLDHESCDRGKFCVQPLVFSAVTNDEHSSDGGGDDDDDDDDADDDGYGLDDELVPWQVSGKLGRQRMRKLGKRVFAKMSHSSQNRYRFVKPGCVHGKHGLGIKA